LPVPYFDLVYTLPSKLRNTTYHNKRVVYDLLMKAAAETMQARHPHILTLSNGSRSQCRSERQMAAFFLERRNNETRPA
jgi:hypothetical protein